MLNIRICGTPGKLHRPSEGTGATAGDTCVTSPHSCYHIGMTHDKRTEGARDEEQPNECPGGHDFQLILLRVLYVISTCIPNSSAVSGCLRFRILMYRLNEESVTAYLLSYDVINILISGSTLAHCAR